MGREERNVGRTCFSTDQLHAQLINPGEPNNQKGEVYILYIINIPEDKKK